MMTDDEMINVVDVNEEAPTTEKEEDLSAKWNEVMDDAKDVAGKAVAIVGDAAKVATDFASEQLKQAKGVFNKVKSNINEEKSRRILEKYNPLFPDDIECLTYPKMIHVTEDDKRLQFKECRGAVGFRENVEGVDVLSILKKEADKFEEPEFYPYKDPAASVYYAHPLLRNMYIEADRYFEYLEEQKVVELVNIAWDLGASYFKVEIFKEASASESSQIKSSAKVGVKANKKKAKAGIDVEDQSSEKGFESVKIAAENSFEPSTPKEPTLLFWANDPAITNLVRQRLSGNGRLQAQKYSLHYQSSYGIKEKEAAKIDGALAVLNFGGKVSFQKEVQQGMRKKFEYTIQF